MTRKDKILQELSELNSSLGANMGQKPYQVPAGYFDNLAENVLVKIKALEAATAREELMHLSPLLAELTKEMPYTVPQGYFEQLAVPGNLTAAEELASISPLLSGLKKENLYSVPEGYFENLSSAPYSAAIKPQAKVVSITSRRWFRIAAAAVVAGVIVTAGFVFINGNSNKSEKALAKFEKKLQKDLEKTSNQELNEFLELTDGDIESTEQITAGTDNDIKELLKDIPESELKEFLEETSGTENSNMN